MGEQMQSVTHVVADGAPGGGTTFVLGLCEHQKALGQKVTLICEPDSYAAEQGRQRGLTVAEFNFFRWPRKGAGHGELASLLRKHRADVFHVHGPRAGLPVALNAKHGALVYTVHGYHFRKKNPLLRCAGVMAEKILKRRTDWIVHVSAADARFAASSGIAKQEATSAILNGVREITQAPTPWVERRYDVVFASRMVHQKNPLFAADVLKRLVAEGRQVAVVGGGGLQDDFKAALGESALKQVEWLGALSHLRTLEVLQQSRALLFPSLWEGLPLTPMEAMMSGCLVVASDIEGSNEVIKDRRNGLLMPKFDVEAYVQAIVELLDHPKQAEQLSAQARKDALDQFTQNRCFGEYQALYKRLCCA